MAVTGSARGRTAKVMSTRVDGGVTSRRPDHLIVEEPMEIRLDDHLVSTTMRTPGHDYELAVGFCHGEGLIDGIEVQAVRYCATGSAVRTEFNVVSVSTGGRAAEPRARLGTVSSSCGVCGSEAVDQLTARLVPFDVTAPTPDVDLLATVGASVRGAQELFELTGGVHAAAAFSLADGALVVVREDIGRHNAVDKVVGHLVLGGTERLGLGLWVSGRASFEMVQKAWAAGFGVLVSVSATSALAVKTARAANLRLVAFSRGSLLTTYDR